ncbi:unnamed protein product, partial [Meganyctiphanes norvegica]
MDGRGAESTMPVTAEATSPLPTCCCCSELCDLHTRHHSILQQLNVIHTWNVIQDVEETTQPAVASPHKLLSMVTMVVFLIALMSLLRLSHDPPTTVMGRHITADTSSLPLLPICMINLFNNDTDYHGLRSIDEAISLRNTNSLIVLMDYTYNYIFLTTMHICCIHLILVTKDRFCWCSTMD